MTRPPALCLDDSSLAPYDRKTKMGMQAHAMCKDPWGAGAGITPWGSGMRPSERAVGPGPDPMTGPAKVATKRGHTTGEARGAADETGEALRAALACTNDENRSEQRSDDDIRPRTQPHPPKRTRCPPRPPTPPPPRDELATCSSAAVAPFLFAEATTRSPPTPRSRADFRRLPPPQAQGSATEASLPTRPRLGLYHGTATPSAAMPT